MRMFGERPYAAVSTTDLAKEAGVARGLINHYFGTKRDLYLAVVEKVAMVPDVERSETPSGSTAERAAIAVDWLLGVVDQLGRTWVAVMGAEGIGDDPEVARILDDADDAAAERVLDIVGVTGGDHRAELRAMVRAYGGMAKSAGREWVTREALTREQVRMLLTDSLVTLVEETFPRVVGR
ncbi:helix-turn-helix transcriptional regulator [Antrihabitans cavernicola]|uniref:Helix-turn-helix transcriptional regulator n=2 Tax=Antrihabitans cavernicola TaxID=2495913 RepID=A0A5A7SC42_9NOCA|nr:helix-turn-helix transcriptional regulator [Spelaeibacter cavernicola]